MAMAEACLAVAEACVAVVEACVGVAEASVFQALKEGFGEHLMGDWAVMHKLLGRNLVLILGGLCDSCQTSINCKNIG